MKRRYMGMNRGLGIMPDNVKVRDASLDDAKRILEIYSYYVRDTAISFEYDPPSLKDFQDRMVSIMSKFPYLVLERDGEIIGFSYAGILKDRAAYDRACETTIYLDRTVRRCGYGRRLYESLEARLKDMGMLNLYAAVAYPDADDEYLDSNSLKFHKHMGYAEAGNFHKCGYKYGRWYNLAWMEKIIGEHT